jgi:(2Fe-2S) ferredoxin/ubiquinone/menaquinone biosynthesis C-methylase UbiE
MEPFHYHVFICNQQKPEGLPCCYNNGSAQVIDALRREIAAGDLEQEVQLTVCGSLGLCEHGPNIVVYPEGIWYSGVSPSDVPEIVQSHFRRDTPVERLIRTDPGALRTEILWNRDQMRAAARTRESSGALPDELNARIRAFQESRAILTALELDIFTAVGEPATAAEVSAKLHIDGRATEMLLNALAAIGLLIKKNGSFQNGPASARFFSTSSPDCARTALLHTANLWKSWSNLTEAVRTGTAVDDAGRPDGWVETFIAAMHRNASERAGAVVHAVGVVRGRMLDIGGGSGAYSIAFAQANPQLEIDLVDQPDVGPIAQAHIQEAGLEGRIHVLCGDMRDSLPQNGYEMTFLSAICHMLSPEENFALLKRCFAVLAPKGRVVIQDFILDEDKTAPKQAALFALNMLTGTRAGSTYSEAEYTTWLEAAGFQSVRHLRMPGPASLMVASRE